MIKITPMLKEYIGNIIKHHRQLQNLTLEELAIRINSDRQHLCKIEKGKINLTLEYLEKILNALNLQPEIFFNQPIHHHFE